jgi:hypothetical protein
MKCASEMGSDATVCIPSFIQIASAIQKFIGGGGGGGVKKTKKHPGERVSPHLIITKKGN